MAFLVRRTISCDHEGCNSGYSFLCRKKYEVEKAAKEAGWEIQFEHHSYDDHTHYCPEHKDH